ncbi:ABC transporter permease [Allosediminivita pacifica]|uniref:Putative spermidine/putrescine transport system permease protein n=1 Tax=Allosediminivita pacifica TaxID=1267769 RepID=A0A2T6A034_9RHOB|nr:ABC transporter permease [Allosediminivita pacifica]PTX37167.1 putative spermidine/putrescine transport system permease protein [Allosediminivita pacifica]GGB30313.1 ABC transporter permease [Allosediminivita pacifica]
MKALLRRLDPVPVLLSLPAGLLLGLFLLIPLAATAILSLQAFSLYTGIQSVFNLDNYVEIFSDGYFGEIFLRTARTAALTTVLTILIGAPEAVILMRMKAPWRGIFLLVALGPLLISVVSRTLGWALLFGSTGIINDVLIGLGLIAAPLQFMYTETGVVIALAHVLLPFMIISVMTTLQRLNPLVESASYSLGASGFTTFRRVILPQVLPGIFAGSIIVFAMAASAFATPQIIGGRRLKVVATLVYDEYLFSLNWPLGAALALLLFVIVIIVAVGFNQLAERRFRRLYG